MPALQPANRNVFNYLPQSIKMQVRVVQRYSRLPFLQRGAVACRRNHTTFQDLARKESMVHLLLTGSISTK